MSRRAVIVDDHLLVRILLHDEPPSLRPGGAPLLTTGLWYQRLCRTIGAAAVATSLARHLGGAGSSIALAAVRAATTLPETVGLLSWRELAWPVSRLMTEGLRLDLLSLEALAAAEQRGAELCLASTDDNPLLLAAAAARSTPARLVSD